jgi:DNA-binding NarL/FixJ family response regulator
MLAFCVIHVRIGVWVGWQQSRVNFSNRPRTLEHWVMVFEGRYMELGKGMAVRILLVDDHPVVRQGLRTLLQERSELEVVDEASDGVEALEKVSSSRRDVVVLDVTMPRMNGIEACRIIKRENPGLEVLFVTQHDSPQMMREALAAGARGYVVKSNLARDLVEAVEAVSQHREFTALARTPN